MLYLVNSGTECIVKVTCDHGYHVINKPGIFGQIKFYLMPTCTICNSDWHWRGDHLVANAPGLAYHLFQICFNLN